MSAVEFKGAADEVQNTHYNGHPNTTIGHWIIGRGHNDSGASLLFMDPATSVFPKAAKSFTMSTSKFQKFVATNGIVW